MNKISSSLVGHWFESSHSQEVFEVVAVDDTSLEIQYFDGDIEEIDQDIWHNLNANEIAQPTDWRGPYEDID